MMIYTNNSILINNNLLITSYEALKSKTSGIISTRTIHGNI